MFKWLKRRFKKVEPEYSIIEAAVVLQNMIDIFTYYTNENGTKIEDWPIQVVLEFLNKFSLRCK